MKDFEKSKEQLIMELVLLRDKNARLEATAAHPGGEPTPQSALDSLTESEKKFRALTENTTAHISITQDDRVVYANQAFLDFNELDVEDLKLVTSEDLTVGSIGPEAIARIMPLWQAAMERGDTHFSFEIPYLDGTWFQTDVTMMELGGEPAFMVMEFDITAHKRAQEALGESEKKFRALAESTTAQIIITQDDRFVYANRAALDHRGLTWEELSERSPQEVMSEDNEVTEECAAWAEDQLKQGGGRFRTVYSETDAQGVEHWFEAHVTRLDIDGEPAWISTAFDITELKRAQGEMYRADKMAALGQIVAGVAHEINNPNNFIYFNLPILRKYIEAISPLLEQRLEQDPDLEILGMPYADFVEDVFKLLENMEHGSKRITSIVSDLKNYVHSDADTERKVEQVGLAIERVMTLVGKQVRKMVKRFDVDIAEGLSPVLMNLGKIEQVLINLLINAGHAADKEDSWVKLSARMAAGAGDWIELRVEDNGSGMSTDIQDKVFEPFFTSKGREQGTGLGLSISHRIVEEHQGTISVESRPGEGACFTVLLPATPQDAT